MIKFDKKTKYINEKEHKRKKLMKKFVTLKIGK